jgi:hypothetical protein
MFGEIIRKFIHLTRMSRFEEDFAAEIQFHLETRIADLENEGLSKEQAVAQARGIWVTRASERGYALGMERRMVGADGR